MIRVRFDTDTGADSLGELTRWNEPRTVVADRCSFEFSDLGVAFPPKWSDSDARRSCIGVGIWSIPKADVSAIGDISGGNCRRGCKTYFTVRLSLATSRQNKLERLSPQSFFLSAVFVSNV